MDKPIRCEKCAFYYAHAGHCRKGLYSCTDNGETCETFIERPQKECSFRYEDCNSFNPNCTTICKALPSKHGCDFQYMCTLDHRLCDGDCQPHMDRDSLRIEQETQYKETHVRDTLRSYLYDPEIKWAVNKLIEYIDQKIATRALRIKALEDKLSKEAKND